MEKRVKRIGVLTSGGDAPGMNAAVRAVVRTATNRGVGCVGIRRGWNGLINSDFVQMNASSVSHIINKGGTMLYTARSMEFMDEGGRAKALSTCRLLGLDGIVAIGGDGTFRGALALHWRAVSACAQEVYQIGQRDAKAGSHTLLVEPHGGGSPFILIPFVLFCAGVCRGNVQKLAGCTVIIRVCNQIFAKNVPLRSIFGYSIPDFFF